MNARKEYHAKYYLENRERILRLGAVWYGRNRARKLANGKAWRDSNPARTKAYWLKTKYSITSEEYDFMFRVQGGACAICRINPAIVVDHDHSSGVVRGLLCYRCNTSIGLMKDSVELLLGAVAYLKDSGRGNGQNL